MYKFPLLVNALLAVVVSLDLRMYGKALAIILCMKRHGRKSSIEDFKLTPVECSYRYFDLLSRKDIIFVFSMGYIVQTFFCIVFGICKTIFLINVCYILPQSAISHSFDLFFIILLLNIISFAMDPKSDLRKCIALRKIKTDDAEEIIDLKNTLKNNWDHRKDYTVITLYYTLILLILTYASFFFFQE